MCWTTPMRATSSGGSSMAAGMRKTIVVWYDWSRGVRTTKSWATAAHEARTRKVGQPCVPGFRCESGTRAAATAMAAAVNRYALAWRESDSSVRSGPLRRSVAPNSLEGALIYVTPGDAVRRLALRSTRMRGAAEPWLQGTTCPNGQRPPFEGRLAP